MHTLTHTYVCVRVEANDESTRQLFVDFLKIHKESKKPDGKILYWSTYMHLHAFYAFYAFYVCEHISGKEILYLCLCWLKKLHMIYADFFLIIKRGILLNGQFQCNKRVFLPQLWNNGKQNFKASTGTVFWTFPQNIWKIIINSSKVSSKNLLVNFPAAEGNIRRI